jgi:hypothetical protein
LLITSSISETSVEIHEDFVGPEIPGLTYQTGSLAGDLFKNLDQSHASSTQPSIFNSTAQHGTQLANQVREETKLQITRVPTKLKTLWHQQKN